MLIFKLCNNIFLKIIIFIHNIRHKKQEIPTVKAEFI